MKKIIIIAVTALLCGSFCFSQDSISVLHPDSAVTLKDADQQEQEESDEAEIFIKGDVCGFVNYEIISYALMGLSFVLLLTVFFLLWKISRNRKDIQSYMDRVEYNEVEKNFLLKEKNTMMQEVEKYKKENKRLLDNLNELQLELQSADEPVEQPFQPAEPQPQTLYADAIIDGKFNNVKEYPDDNTIFELNLNKAGDTQATVIIHKAAEPLVTKRPEFLDGCEKQILGNSAVIMLNEGIAHKDSNGKWRITTIPEVKIS